MCGIAGIISFNSSRFPFQCIAAMNQSLAHRGPDDEGIALFSGRKSDISVFGGNSTPKFVYTSQYQFCPSIPLSNEISPHTKLALGHRRLSILDLSAAGHQPMCTEDGRYWIVYNGEIYNFKEIRNELIKEGEHFFSETDTEVLLKAYRLWGKGCLSLFNGMWAFAIYDRNTNNIFISIDRFGKKPLYYFMDQKCFVFASEIKALLKVPIIRTAPSIGYCKSYIEKGCKEFRRKTAFKNIFRFSPGSYVEVNLNLLSREGLNEKKFWKLNPNLDLEPFDAQKAERYTCEYYELLLNAVRIRLRSDVRVGSALSGGLDSSSIVYLINKLLKNQLNDDKQVTFSSVYKSKNVRDCDESIFIDKLSEFLNVVSKQSEPCSDDIPKEHKRMIYALDTPPEGTLMSSWYTFKCVQKNNIKVTLDGQGADEQLAGYLPYIITYISNCKKDILKESWLLAQIPGTKKIIPIGMIINIAKIFLPKSLLLTFLRLTGRKRDPYEPLNLRLASDTLNNLMTLFHFADRVSMAHSVESRMPFMDFRLVEYIASIPECYKIHNGSTKFIARLAMDKKLPDEITWRKDKMGWPIPEKYWFQNPLKEWFCRTIENSYFLKELNFSKDIRKHVNNGKNFDKLIRLLNLAVWQEVFFESPVK